MMASQQRQAALGPRRFIRAGVVADASAAAEIRSEFARWLRCHTRLSETRLGDVVLAVNEAIANVVEFAYAAQSRRGPVDVEAVHDPAPQVLTVAVSDEGCWRDSSPLADDRSRGHGIMLMHTLADAVVINTSALGTRVCLRFDGVESCPIPGGAAVTPPEGSGG